MAGPRPQGSSKFASSNASIAQCGRPRRFERVGVGAVDPDLHGAVEEGRRGPGTRCRGERADPLGKRCVFRGHVLAGAVRGCPNEYVVAAPVDVGIVVQGLCRLADSGDQAQRGRDRRGAYTACSAPRRPRQSGSSPRAASSSSGPRTGGDCGIEVIAESLTAPRPGQLATAVSGRGAVLCSPPVRDCPQLAKRADIPDTPYGLRTAGDPERVRNQRGALTYRTLATGSGQRTATADGLRLPAVRRGLVPARGPTCRTMQAG